MLNIGKLAAGGEDYYLATVARSVESYYLGKGEAPGRWIGRGLEPLAEIAERVARRLHDVELHRQQQERELDRDLGHGLSL